MLLAIAAVIIGAVSAVVVVHLRESHLSVNELLADIEELSPEEDTTMVHTSPDAPLHADSAVTGPADVLFTETLLALGRVGLRGHDDSREPELAESSLLVSARPAR